MFDCAQRQEHLSYQGFQTHIGPINPIGPIGPTGPIVPLTPTCIPSLLSHTSLPISLLQVKTSDLV